MLNYVKIYLILIAFIGVTTGLADADVVEISQTSGSASAWFGQSEGYVNVGQGQSFYVAESGFISEIQIYLKPSTGNPVPTDQIICDLRDPTGMVLQSSSIEGFTDGGWKSFNFDKKVTRGNYIFTCYFHRSYTLRSEHYSIHGNSNDNSYLQGTRYTSTGGHPEDWSTWKPNAWDLKFKVIITTEKPSPTEPPSPPQNFQAAAGDGHVKLSWDAPDDDGGSPVTRYRVYRDTTSRGEKTLLTTVGNVLTYTDSDVINEQTYYYHVSAVNAVGEGEKSEEAYATPTSGATKPLAPQTLKSESGDNKVKLEWDAPDDDGGTPIAGYKVYRGTTSGERKLLTTVENVLTHEDTTAINNQTYYYQVSAVNSAGEGIKSNYAMGTPTKKHIDWVIIAALIGAAAAIIAAIINYLVSRKRRYGSVSATSRPDGARVFLDGVDKGESPVTLNKIRKGTHIVLFSKSGYSDCEKRVVVNADQITAVHCDLKKLEMKLRLSAEPAEIPADGKSKSVITISVEDENGTPAPVPEEMTIVLETDIGLIDTPVSITAGDVSATSILTSSTAGGTATVRAKSGTGLKDDVAVRFV